MAISKVAYDGHTLIDLTQDTAVESDVASGKYFHKADGTRVQGTASGGGGTIIPRTCAVTLTIYDNTADPEPGATDTIDYYYRYVNSSGVLAWKKETITFALGTSSTHNFNVLLLAADDVCKDGFYLGRLWDGARTSDVTVTGGNAAYITTEPDVTASEHCYILLTGTTATVHIDIPEGYR